MARIAGVNIPTNKRVLIALQYIHGIGQKNAAEIIEKILVGALGVRQLPHGALLSVAGWTVLPGSPLRWTLLGVLAIVWVNYYFFVARPRGPQSRS